MPVFSNGKKEPEPGRPIVRHEVIKETHTEQQQIDVTALAKAVAEALGKMPGRGIVNGEEYEDDFSNAKSLDKLADSMTVQRGNSEANFDDLGGVKETKKDVKEVNKTIDLLRGLDN
ncbi:hypothetical protein D4R86_04740 [bacterium]|nr:MAG: hypothetical protein D4R86_04740 [bacterium]